MTTERDQPDLSFYWDTIDRLQDELTPQQAIDSYGSLLHEIPLPVWVEDWSGVLRRLHELDLPEPEEVEA